MAFESRRERRPRRPRWLRRVRRWWRETPSRDAAQTLVGLGLLLVVIAALIALTA